MIRPQQAAQFSGGRWIVPPQDPQEELRGASCDTRTLGAAQIFFALCSDSGDGHDHLQALPSSSVRLAVLARPQPIKGFTGAVLQVADPLRALADMAAGLVCFHRPYVVAITGSYGKTTTKELVAHALSGSLRVLRSPGSYNNEIGVPLTLLHLDGTQDIVVLEYSARHPGDIAYLSRIAPPQVGVLTGVGHAHIGVFGSLEAIYRTKGEIFSRLPADGLALVPAEDAHLQQLALGHRVCTVGREKGELRAESLRIDREGRQHFLAVWKELRVAMHAALPGPGGFFSALVAWRVALELGLDPEAVAQRIGEAPTAPGRVQLLHGQGGAMLVDDTYNASPETVLHLIELLRARAESHKVLVLGTLSELEEGLGHSAAQIAEHLQPPLVRCLVHDPLESGLARALEARAPSSIRLEILPEHDALHARLHALDTPDTVIGFKGGRAAHMERFVLRRQGRQVGCQRQPCPLLLRCADCTWLAEGPAHAAGFLGKRNPQPDPLT